MCRLFGMVGAGASAEHWLLNASNSMRALGRTNPHGTGVGGFVDGAIRLEKSALAAPDDLVFGHQPWLTQSPTLVAHVRDATVSAPGVMDSHPFAMQGRLFAQNGSIGEIHRVEDALGDYERLVHGNTDSERYGALLTRHIDEADGNVEQGIRRTVGWLADNTPMTGINFVLATPDDLYALRYPHVRTLFYNHVSGSQAVEGARRLGGVELGAGRGDVPATIVASEPLDASAGWRALQPGQLLHVRAGDLSEEVVQVIDRAPKRLLDDNFRTGDAPVATH